MLRGTIQQVILITYTVLLIEFPLETYKKVSLNLAYLHFRTI